MQRVPVLVIGAGQAGLAMSRCLAARGVGHVVLERGRVGERWRSERWESLRLLSPNWMTRLPGWSYRGDDPDGFMTSGEVAAYLEAYAEASRAPVVTGAAVTALRRIPGGYRVETEGAGWEARAVVIATGHCDRPLVPAMACDLPAAIHQVTPVDYRSPDALPPGGVLVVGASATGVQLAAEIRATGRPVAISIGRHIRLPRRYRGRDIWWWLERAGVLDEPTTDIRDLERTRAQPSFQLVGRPDGATIDLGLLRDAGVRLLGRAVGVEGGVLRLADDLAETTGAAQAALERLLARLDIAADADGAPTAEPDASRRFEVPASPATLDLAADGFGSVLWATGYRRDYAWLKVPVLDAAGEIRHAGGVTPSPGLYVLGLRLLRRRRSSFIDGVGRDAGELAAAIHGHLARPVRAAA
jgi:putative flavoprotein involved in K+ transport